MKKSVIVRLFSILLQVVLVLEAAGCLLGGYLLVIAPDGRLMDMPVTIMHGTFRNFLVPGILLFCLGLLNAAAFGAYVKKVKFQWLLVFGALASLLGWFWIEIAILRQVHWLHAVWGGPVVLATIAALFLYPWQQKSKLRVLLACGIVASVLYVIINIIVPLQWRTYDIAGRTVSELSAIGAPTRFLWTILCAPYTLLMICFGVGVLEAAGKNRQLHIAGTLLLVYAMMGFLWPFASMHQREALAAGLGSQSDQLHLGLGAITEVIFLLALYFASAALGKSFKVYSIATFLVLLTFGGLTFAEAPGVAANSTTPFIGGWERINIGVFLIWVVVLAFMLIRNGHDVAIKSRKDATSLVM